jgi:hypothetical protein
LLPKTDKELPPFLFNNDKITQDLIKNKNKDLIVMSLHSLDINMDDVSEEGSFNENLVHEEEEESLESSSSTDILKEEKLDILDRVFNKEATKEDIYRYREIIKLLSSNLFGINKLTDITDQSVIKYVNNDFNNKHMRTLNDKSEALIPNMFPIDINEHILQLEPIYRDSSQDISYPIQVIEGKYAHHSKAVEHFNKSVLLSADWQCYHTYVCSTYLFEAYNNFVSNRVNIAIIDYDKKDIDSKTQEDYVGKCAFGVLSNYYGKKINCTISPQSNYADAIVKLAMVKEDQDLFKRQVLPNGIIVEENLIEDDALICEFKTIQGLEAYATMIQASKYINASISVIKRHFVYIQKGNYVIFYENNVDYFEKNNINLNLRNPDLKNILGLYVTNKGVEIIPVKNSYFPQVKAYNLAEERDVFAINVLFRYLTLNGHPPIRNLDYSVAESF